MSAAHIAILSDDPASRRRLRSLLAIQNYLVCDTVAGEAIDLVLLDICDGSASIPESCYALRADSDVAVIVLARRATEGEKIAALDAGADDFLVHPFSDSELLARIRVVLRRRPVAHLERTMVELDGLRIDLATRRVISGARQSHLTPKEAGLLACLLQNPNATVPHWRLLRAVWGQPCRDQGACLRVMVNQLRRKIERDPGNPRYLVTERWVGYRFQLPEERAARSINGF